METNTARNPLLDLPTFTKYLQNRLGKSYLPGPFSSEGSGVIKTNFYRIVPTCARDPLVAEIEITSLPFFVIVFFLNLITNGMSIKPSSNSYKKLL